MLKSEWLEKRRRWFQEKYGDTWEAKWEVWVESNPKVPGDDPEPEAPTDNVTDVSEESPSASVKKKKKTSKRKV